MKRYLRIYWQLLVSNWTTLLTYPGDAVGSIISSIGWGTMSVIGTALLTSQVTTVAGWSRGEMLLMTATYGIIVGSFHVFFSPNFSNFGNIIHMGDLDTYLLRPVSAPVILSVAKVKYTSLLRVVASIILGVVLFALFGMETSLLQVLAFTGLIGVAFLLLYGLNLTMATLLIFFPDSENLMELIGVATGTARYPADLLHNVPRIFFVVFLPFLVIVSIPTKVLIGKALSSEVMLFAGIALALFAFSFWFWNFAMHWYTGASR